MDLLVATGASEILSIGVLAGAGYDPVNAYIRPLLSGKIDTFLLPPKKRNCHRVMKPPGG